MTQQQTPTSETLNRAADLIQERGWIGCEAAGDDDPWGRDGESPLCLEGGIMAATGIYDHGFVEACPAYLAVQDYLNRRVSPLYRWNDKYERTAEEVIATLRAAAAIEAAREAEPLDANGRGTGESELTAEVVAS